MKAIGFKNFRNFEELPMMDINGVTILVGPNNSGKSTITKAIRLLSPQMYKCVRFVDGFGHDEKVKAMFDFSGVCNTFKRAYRYGASGPMEFTVKTGYFTTSYILKDGNISENDHMRELKEITVYNEVDDFTWRCCFEDEVVKVEYNGKLLSHIIREDVRQRLRNDKVIGKVYKGAEELGWGLSKAVARMNKKVKDDDAQLEFEIALGEMTEDVYRKAFSRIADDDLRLADELENDKERRLLVIPLNQVSRKGTYGPSIEFPLYEGEPFTFLRRSDDSVNLLGGRKLSAELLRHMLVRVSEEQILEHYNLTKSGVEWIVNHDQEYDCVGFFSHLKKDYENSLSTTIYLPAVETPLRSVFYLKEQSDEFSQLIKYLYYSDLRSERVHWIEQRMQELGIGTELHIDDSNGDGEVLKVFVTNPKGVKVPISDLGRGSVRIVMMLINVILVVSNLYFIEEWPGQLVADDDQVGYGKFQNTVGFPGSDVRRRSLLNRSPILIIEEPEQNLHPAMQSKLADLFLKIRSLGYEVIVETHSEYLVRRSQVIVAEKNYVDRCELERENPFSVYYVPSDGDIYKMHYKITGTFEDKFGPGFFDESSVSDMVLIRKELEQKKKNLR